MTTIRPQSRQPMPDDARRVFKGRLFDVYQWDQRLFDGTTATFEKLKRPDTAYVIPVTSEGKLILVEQLQPGATTVMGLLGGRIEDGETPEQGARRELREEAGLEAGTISLWDSYQFLPKIDWAIYTFVARNCTFAQNQMLDGGEKIKLVHVSFDEFLKLVSRENFGDLEVALRVLRMSSDPVRLERMKDLFA